MPWGASAHATLVDNLRFAAAEGRVRALARDVRRQLAGQAVQARHAQVDGVLERQADAVLELGHAARIAGEAALSRVPVAWGEIVQDGLQPVAVQPARDLFRFERVREQEFDGLEAGRAGGGEAVEEVDFIEQQAQVGGKAWHPVMLTDSPPGRGRR